MKKPVEPTIREYFDYWLYAVKISEIKRTSFDTLERTIENHIYPRIGDIRLSDICSCDVRDILNCMLTLKYSHSMIKKVFDAMNACLKFAVLEHDLSNNPMYGMKSPSKKMCISKEIYVYNEQEIKSIVKEATTKYSTGNYKYNNGLAYILILNTGLRLGEVLGLKWSDLHLSQKYIEVNSDIEYIFERDSFNQKTGRVLAIEQATPKSEASIRKVYLNNTAINILEYYRKKQEAMNIKSRYIICNKDGNFLSSSSFRKSYSTILRNANVRKTGIHALRHTFATELYKKGIEVKKISKILGHSSVKITYDTYIHIWESDICNTTDVLDDVFKL